MVINLSDNIRHKVNLLRIPDTSRNQIRRGQFSRSNATVPLVFQTKSRRSDKKVILNMPESSKTLINVIRNQYPIVWDTLKFGMLYTSAEIMQQVLMKKVLDSDYNVRPLSDSSRLPIEWLAVCRYAVWGFGLFPHILRYWYRFLDSKFDGPGWKAAWQKTLVDQIFFPLPILVAFYLFLSLLEGNTESWKAFTAECRAKLLITLKARYCFMFPAQLINFSFISPANRVMFIAVISYFWLTILSIIEGLDVDNPIFKT